MEKIDWAYGVLKCKLKDKEDKDSKINPYFLDNITIFKKKAIGFMIKGQGKVIQISFTSDSKSATIAVELDNQERYVVNNGYCLENICDTRGIGNIQIQKIKEGWRYTCLIPFIFDKKITVLIGNEAIEKEDIHVTNVHIYYLIPKKVEIK